MLGFGPLSGGAISGGGEASAPTFDVTGLAAVAFGTPALPVLPHAVSGLVAIAFGTPAIPVRLTPEVEGVEAVALGTPHIIGMTSSAIRPIKIRIAGIEATRFGRPTI